MEDRKTVAERLREKTDSRSLECWLAKDMLETGCDMICHDYFDRTTNALADMIEAEQAVDVAALSLLCDKLEMGGEKSRDIAMQVRAALNGAERRKMEYDGVIPEGIEWPRYESGELVEFGDVVGKGDIWMEHPVDLVAFYDDGGFELVGDGNSIAYRKGEPVKRPEPEVLDVDGVPIKVGDTVWNVESGKRYEVLKLPAKNAYQSIAVRGEDGTDGFDPTRLTHRKPDTQEAIEADAVKNACVYYNGTERATCFGCKSPSSPDREHGDTDYDECRNAQVLDILRRQRKLLGGE